MAVYTQLSRSDVAEFLIEFGWPQLLDLVATSEGIENTNYFVTVADSQGAQTKLVLTLFETLKPESLPYYVQLLTYLGNQGMPVAKPYKDLKGKAIHHIKDKPALVVPCLVGAHIQQPNLAQCAAVGTAMARMHAASANFLPRQDNLRGAQWRQHMKSQLPQWLNPQQTQLLNEQVDRWQADLTTLERLPHGITHGDLFHDNALFCGDELTGIIDFYNASHDLLLYDLAVLVNDWCSNKNLELDPARYRAVLAAYERTRPISATEKAHWPSLLAYAALRFWISRLWSWHQNPAHSKVSQKDPATMEQLLKNRLQHPGEWL